MCRFSSREKAIAVEFDHRRPLQSESRSSTTSGGTTSTIHHIIFFFLFFLQESEQAALVRFRQRAFTQPVGGGSAATAKAQQLLSVLCPSVRPSIRSLFRTVGRSVVRTDGRDGKTVSRLLGIAPFGASRTSAGFFFLPLLLRSRP